MQELALKSDSHQAIERAEVVFVDSREALDVAYARGLNPAAEIRSIAPALLDDSDLDAVHADSALTPEVVRALEDATIALSRDCRTVFAQDEDIAVIAGRAALLRLQPIVARAISLGDADFTRPVAVVRLKSEQRALDEEFDTPLISLLAANPDLSVVDVSVDSLAGAYDPRPPTPGVWQRLSFASPGTLTYRLVERLATRFGLRGPRGTILVVRENELGKETSLWMMLRGYLPRRLKMLRLTDVPPLTETDRQDLKRRLGEFMALRFAAIFSDRCLAAVEESFCRLLADEIARYRASLVAWSAEIDGLRRYRPRAVFFNHLNEPELVGMHRVLRDRRIPLVGFQHGVTLEINSRLRHYDAWFDSAVADLELTFNDEGVAVSDKGAYTTARAVSVGLPAEYRRGRRFGGLRDAPPVWYLATALYLANEGLLAEGANDLDRATFERNLIDRVLGRLPHGVLYKPYPGRRYLDPDPVLADAEDRPNISVYARREDVRYIVRSARILIAARSFSTPSWCLAADKPLVHIDIPDQAPLTPEARAAFDAGLFLFDAGAADFHDSLLAFLSRPLDDIEAEWRDKAAARAELMRRFMSAYPSGAGRRAAAEVAAEIAKAQ